MLTTNSPGKQYSEKDETVKNFSVGHSKKSLRFQRKPKTINTQATHRVIKTERTLNKEDSQYLSIKPNQQSKFTYTSFNKGSSPVHSDKVDQPTERFKKPEKPNNSRAGRADQEAGQYYKYWKAKATQYQESNFNLNRVNSALQEENEILKFRYKKLQQKYDKLKTNQVVNQENNMDFPRIQEYYRHQLEENKKIMDEQAKVISRQEKKIKELSKYISENYQLKSVLENLEEKVNEVSASNKELSVAKSRFQDDRSFGEKSFANFLTTEKVNKGNFRGNNFQDRSFDFKSPY